MTQQPRCEHCGTRKIIESGLCGFCGRFPIKSDTRQAFVERLIDVIVRQVTAPLIFAERKSLAGDWWPFGVFTSAVEYDKAVNQFCRTFPEFSSRYFRTVDNVKLNTPITY